MENLNGVFVISPSFYECMGVFRELACTGVEVHSSTRTVTCTTVHIYLDNVYLYVLVSCGVQCGDLNPGSKNKFFLCILLDDRTTTKESRYRHENTAH